MQKLVFFVQSLIVAVLVYAAAAEVIIILVVVVVNALVRLHCYDGGIVLLVAVVVVIEEKYCSGWTVVLRENSSICLPVDKSLWRMGQSVLPCRLAPKSIVLRALGSTDRSFVPVLV